LMGGESSVGQQFHDALARSALGGQHGVMVGNSLQKTKPGSARQAALHTR
jgi:hypothetical protein